MFAESLALLEEIRSGARLPQTSSEQSRQPDTHGVRRGGRGWGRGEKDGERERRGRRGERGGEEKGDTHEYCCCYILVALLLQGSIKFSNSLPLHDPRNLKVDCTQLRSSPSPLHLILNSSTSHIWPSLNSGPLCCYGASPLTQSS